MTGRLPLTYVECRARFERAATDAGVPVASHPITARGPSGEELALGSVRLGPEDATRWLVVLSGVHGVEGFVHSAVQCEVLRRWAAQPLEVGVLLVHAVNPWGMAWWRRQNESNVDLNRNWRRDDGVPFVNEAYEHLHPLACPDTPELPAVDEVLVQAQALVAERGLEWVRDGITTGQYTHPDGLHFGGERTEESNLILEDLVSRTLAGAERVLTVDLHTGHGRYGELTALCDQPPGSPQHELLARFCDRVEATTGNPHATTGLKAGQIANGFRTLLPHTTCASTSLEVGTADDLTQLGATYQEQWVHRRGTRDEPSHRAAVWAYRGCFTPDDPEWEDGAFVGTVAHLERGLAVVMDWR